MRRPLRSWISGSNGRVRVRKTRRPNEREKAERSCYAALRLRDDRFDSIAAILIRLLASTAAPINTLKRWRPSARQRIMPRPRNRTEMRPSTPARKRCPSLKAGLFSYPLRFAVFFPPRCGMHTTLTPFCLHDFTFVSLKEASIGTIQLGSTSEVFLMAFQEGSTC